MKEVVGSAKLVSADRDATSLFCSRVRVLVRRRRTVTRLRQQCSLSRKVETRLERAKERERVCDSDSARRVRDWLNV